MISNAVSPDHLHNRPADDFVKRQPNPFGIGGVRGYIVKVPAAMGQAGGGSVKGLAQFCGNDAQMPLRP